MDLEIKILYYQFLDDLEPAPGSAQAAIQKRLMNTAKVNGETGQDDEIDGDNGANGDELYADVDAPGDAVGGGPASEQNDGAPRDGGDGETDTGGVQTTEQLFELMAQVKDEGLRKEIMALIESKAAFQD